MKKIITLVTAVALATSVLAGCNSNSTGNGTENTAGTAEEKKVTIWLFILLAMRRFPVR